MPTARDLLDQVDALMRRNRSRDKDKRGGPATLTDALGRRRDSTLAPTIILPDAARSHASPIGPEVLAEADPISLDTLADVPILTDVVDVWPKAGTSAEDASTPPSTAAPHGSLDSAPGATADTPALVGDAIRDPAASEAAQATTVAASMPAAEATEATPVRAAALHDMPLADAAPASIEEEFILEIPPAPAPEPKPEPNPTEQPVVEWPPHEEPEPAAPAPHAGSEPAPAVATGGDWDAMAEEIRMQVLQRLDLYTDTGLRDRLAARLQPIVDRASAELVATINRELGELVRGYVADAIEREIESWRKRGT